MTKQNEKIGGRLRIFAKKLGIAPFKECKKVQIDIRDKEFDFC